MEASDKEILETMNALRCSELTEAQVMKLEKMLLASKIPEVTNSFVPLVLQLLLQEVKYLWR